VIAMVGIGNGARAQVESQIASLGQNVIQVSPGSASSRGVRQGADTAVTLTIEDAEAIAEEIPDVVAVSPEVKIKCQIVAGNRNWSASVYGESPDYFTIRQSLPRTGPLSRMFTRMPPPKSPWGSRAAQEPSARRIRSAKSSGSRTRPYGHRRVEVQRHHGQRIDNDDNVIVPTPLR
jgi:hypothetical protein